MHHHAYIYLVPLKVKYHLIHSDVSLGKEEQTNMRHISEEA